MTNLEHAARNVIANWDSGDLAAAVRQLEAALPEALEPAHIVDGELHCSCGHVGLPRLSEHGYDVTHDLVAIEGNQISARGWDGNSSDIGEMGEYYTLECRECYESYALPADFEIDWI